MGKNNLKHGLTGHPLYPRWVSMMARCYNENHNRYHLYGARGIAVCAEWIENPQAYIDYITSLPNALGEGLSIDRIDNDGDYEPDNLRWATKQEQSLNTRQKRNFTGFLGVEPHGRKFKSRIDVESKNVVVGIYPTIRDAVVARDQYIIDNKLETRKLQILTRPTVSEQCANNAHTVSEGDYQRIKEECDCAVQAFQDTLAELNELKDNTDSPQQPVLERKIVLDRNNRKIIPAYSIEDCAEKIARLYSAKDGNETEPKGGI